MKIHHFTLLAAFLASRSFAQTNTLPASGNVGIGTTSPTHSLHVQASSSGSIAYFHNSGSWSGGEFSIQAVGFSDFGGLRLNGQDTARSIYSNNPIGIGTNSQAITFETQIGQEVMRISPSRNVGIGTTAPGSKLEIAAVDPIVRVHNTNDTSGGFMGDTYGVTQIGRYNPSGGQYGNIAAGQARSMLGMDANGRVGTLANNFGNPIWRNILDDGNGNVGIGMTNPTHKLAVNGTIKSKEVIVETTGWSDYVFADDYALAALTEVEAHIKEHKHLPGIPSAAQVAEQGVSVGDMQARLLAKIEELTLHVIAQEKRLSDQEKEIHLLKTNTK